MKGGAIAYISYVPFFLGEGPLVQDPNFFRGISKGEWPMPSPLGGAWPKSAWLFNANSEGVTTLYRYFDALGGRWEKQELLRENEMLHDIAMIGESVIGAIAMQESDIRFALMGGKGGVMPAPYPGPEDSAECKTKMASRSDYRLAGTDSGHAFAAGFECKANAETGGPLAERWEPATRRGVVEPLPAPASGKLKLEGVVAVSATDAYVWGNADKTPYVAHWDGKAWSLEKTPFAKELSTLVASSDGVVFAAANDGFYSKKSGGVWETVALPKKLAGFEPQTVYARTAGDVWVSGAVGKTKYLLRSAKVEKSAVMPSADEVEKTLRPNLRWLATPLCSKPYAHLFSVGPSGSPTPKEFPTAKKAFEGKKFDGAKLVVEDDGRNLFVGAIAGNVDQAESIAKAFAEANPKMKPRVFCHEPKVSKELEW